MTLTAIPILNRNQRQTLQWWKCSHSLYRYHGGTSTGKSYWYTPKTTSNPAAGLALPSGNTYKYVDTYVITKGTTILEGTVAPNFGQPGGGYQYYVPNPPVVLPK